MIVTENDYFNLKSDLKCPICGENKLDEAIIDCFDADKPLRQPTKSKTYWCRNCRKEIIPYEQDNSKLYIKEDGQGLAYGGIDPDYLIPNSLRIECEQIRLFQKGLDIEFELDPKKLKNINVIEINGYRFIKEK